MLLKCCDKTQIDGKAIKIFAGKLHGFKFKKSDYRNRLTIQGKYVT